LSQNFGVFEFFLLLFLLLFLLICHVGCQVKEIGNTNLPSPKELLNIFC